MENTNFEHSGLNRINLQAESQEVDHSQMGQENDHDEGDHRENDHDEGDHHGSNHREGDHHSGDAPFEQTPDESRLVESSSKESSLEESLLEESSLEQTSADESAVDESLIDESLIDELPVEQTTEEAAVVEAIEPPGFGLLDVIEAFTAMRHEWRQQNREHRGLQQAIESSADSINAATDSIRTSQNSLDNAADRLGEVLSESLAASSEARRNVEMKTMIEAIVETDFQISRAAAALKKSDESTQALPSPARALNDAIGSAFRQQNFLARWMSRRFFASVQATVQATLPEAKSSGQTAVSPVAEGLDLLISRVRQIMSDHQIRRWDTLGEPFDAQTMRAISSIESSDVASGHVVEQLAPAYYWNDQILRFADVRVAR